MKTKNSLLFTFTMYYYCGTNKRNSDGIEGKLMKNCFVKTLYPFCVMITGKMHNSPKVETFSQA